MTQRIKWAGLICLIVYGCIVGQSTLAWACGYDDWEPEKAITLLLPELADEAVIWRYDGSEDHADLREVNISDWQDFFWSRAENFTGRRAIESLIYDADLDDITSAYEESKTSSEEEAPAKFSKALSYMSRDTIEYLIFMKQCEKHFAIPLDPWEDVVRDKSGMQRLLEEGRRLYARSHSDFLKLRYAYQLMRLARFMGNPAAAVTFYDELIPHLNVESPIQYWALDQKAGCLGQIERSAEAVYLFSLVFEHAPERRASAYQSFRMKLGGREQWEQCLKYAQSSHEKSVLWALWNSVNGYGESLEFLRNVYTFNPASPVLESLLVHELRKLEGDDSFSQEYIAELKQFVLETASLGKVRRAAFWYIMAAYLAMMEGSSFETGGLLDTAEALLPDSSSHLSLQISILRHTKALKDDYRMSADLEQSLYEDMKALSQRKGRAVRDSLLVLLAQKYLLKGNVPKATLCIRKADSYIFDSNIARSDALLNVYATPEELSELYSLITRESHSSFESFLLEENTLSPGNVLEIQGTHFLRKHQFHEAHRSFKRIPESYWRGKALFETSFQHNPFHNSSDFQNVAKNLDSFNKLSFTEKILDLELQIDIDPSRADWYYWQIGNAFYHTHAWAENSSFYSTIFPQYRYAFNILDNTSWEELDAKIKTRSELITKNELTRESALRYYQKVLEFADNPELGAEAALLAHSCRNPVRSVWDSNYSKYFRFVNDTTYYQVLQDAYQETAFYDRLIEECATFKSFVTKNALNQEKKKDAGHTEMSGIRSHD